MGGFSSEADPLACGLGLSDSLGNRDCEQKGLLCIKQRRRNGGGIFLKANKDRIFLTSCVLY